MSLIGQVFGQQGLVDQARQMGAVNDYQNAVNQYQQMNQQQPQSLQEAQARLGLGGISSRLGLGGMSQGSLQGNSLSNKPAPMPERKVGVMDYMKGYFFKHRELLMGFTLVILLDHFIFAGAFREKTQKIVHALLDKTEKQLIG